MTEVTEAPPGRRRIASGHLVDLGEISGEGCVEAAHQLYSALIAQWEPAILESSSTLGVFEALRTGPASSDEVAESISGDPRSVRLLLEALVAYGWVTRTESRKGESRYAAEEAVIACLTGGSMFSLLGKVGYNRAVSSTAWRGLDHSVRNGVSGGNGEIDNNAISAEQYEDLVTGINFWAPPIVDKLADRLSRDGWGSGEPREILDIGCGSGIYSQLLLRRFEAATAIGLDADNILRIAADQARTLGVAERFDTRAADFWGADWGRDRDLVVFANIFHLVNPSGAATLLEKARAAVGPDGVIAIVDNILVGGLETDSPQDRFASLFALSMLVTGGGTTYELRDYDAWLAGAGLTRTALIDAPMHRIILARPKHEVAQ
ncbi:class I SAM-dependent methyltransferase [Nocardia sp. NPDC051030]|uniref:class I SAM-dependent methyltransferase n=1 Tax=Nocardia sp. NPDC051030 TaxID=3155162 RepID=UPI0034126651